MKNKKFNSLVLKLVESIANFYEENNSEFDDLDITKAIEAGDYLVEGRKKFRDRQNARIFAICIYRKENDGFVNLNLFFFSGKCTATYFCSKGKVSSPMYFKGANWFGDDFRRNLIEITPEFQKEIAENEQLRTAIEKHVVFSNKDESESIMKKLISSLENVDIRMNNEAIESVKAHDEQKMRDEQLRNYANEQEKKLGRTYQFYSEYYRGPYVPAHDDDYNGSGEIGLGTIAFKMNCKTEKDVDELIDKLHNKQAVTKIDGNFRTFYSEKK